MSYKRLFSRHTDGYPVASSLLMSEKGAAWWEVAISERLANSTPSRQAEQMGVTGGFFARGEYSAGGKLMMEKNGSRIQRARCYKMAKGSTSSCPVEMSGRASQLGNQQRPALGRIERLERAGDAGRESRRWHLAPNREARASYHIEAPRNIARSFRMCTLGNALVDGTLSGPTGVIGTQQGFHPRETELGVQVHLRTALHVWMWL